jgi:D-tyrosyl-tRNA(Tyr) deacylase
MERNKRAVFFFCGEPIDPVAGRVLQASAQIHPLEETDMIIDEEPVRKYTDPSDNSFFLVRTQKVVSHGYDRYLPVMNSYFADFDVAGIITWHAGENAPDNILTSHTTGDVDSGNFGPANPQYLRNLLLAMEKNRVKAGLDDFFVTTEATHWSGMVYGGVSAEMIARYPVPMLDIEIGSSPACWSNETAARVLAESLFSIIESDGRRVRNLLCAGGVHFDRAFSGAVFQEWDDCAYGVSHILANQWLITGRYDDEGGPEKLEACVTSIHGGIEAITFHDNLKGVYKDRFRALAAEYGIPVFKHQNLRRPEEISWTDQ